MLLNIEGALDNAAFESMEKSIVEGKINKSPQK
jgi:hypothetical protein